MKTLKHIAKSTERLIVLLAGLLLTACSTTRYVPEGEYLLSRNELEVEGERRPELSVSQLLGSIRQQPNARLFSLFKTSLATYSLSGRDTTKWVNRFIRSIGEPPVIYDSLSVLRSCANLTMELKNRGYLNGRVDYKVRKKGKKARVTYQLYPGEPYSVGNIEYVIEDEQMRRLLTLQNDSTRRLLREGMQFSVATMDEERKRLTSVMNDNGYYRFNKEYITFLADTIAGERVVDLTLRLAPLRRKDLPDTLHTCYTIRDIRYSSGDPADSVVHLRRGVLEECTYFGPGDIYSGSNLQRTYNRFGRMQAVRYTNITMLPAEKADELDCSIQIQNSKPSTISFQPEGTNTSGDLGVAASLTYQNRNLFRGSEVLSVELRGAYEALKGLEGYAEENFVEYSLETKLAFPRFIMPFVGKEFRHSIDATTELSLLYDLQNRPEFHRRVLSAGLRYRWNFPGHRARYQLDLLDLDYVFMPWISSTFRHEYLENVNSRNAILRYNYEDLFITKIGIGYSYSRENFAIKTNLETSGNLLSLGSRLARAERDSMGQYRLFNIAYAQYIKGDIDLTHSFQLDRNNQLVFHFGLGMAYPYGNSRFLPFEKRYFSGGANSVRGWSVRSLGPGTYKEKDGRINFINQTGDMKLDLNAEYRTHLFWKLGGALFVDAGNIWTLRDNPEQDGGQFRFDTFYEQLAASYGIGIRLNFDYFILRLDLGMKAVNPAYVKEESDHYPIIHPKFSRDYAFHFAVGMPF